MARSRLSRLDHSQAVRLPKEVAFPQRVKDVNVIRDGDSRQTTPANAIWDDFFDAPGIDPPLREQPRIEQRKVS